MYTHIPLTYFTYTTSSDSIFDEIHSYDEIAKISKTKNGYEINCILPGYDKEDIKISIEKNNLIVSAAFEKEEYWKKNFSKKINLHDDADILLSTAKLEKGILSIIVPFKPHEKPIEIKIA
jgi:HSP20 family protein